MEENKGLTKEELIERAKELAESTDTTGILSKLNQLKKQWRRTGDDEEESLYDKEMADAFYGYVDQISAKENELFASVEEKKNDLIKKAQEVLNENNFKKASATMQDLMEQWKTAGRTASKELDDELWGKFKTARDEFFSKKNTYYENLRESFAKNKAAKQDLIAQAKEALGTENIKELTNKMNALMEEWKKVGNAGRDSDDDLWKEFSATRKEFFKKRDEYYSNLKETFAKRTEEKKAIIAEAKLCLARSEFSDEEVNTIKGLRAKWKAVGNAGKEHEEELWKEFNEVLDRYFENLRYYK